MHIRPRVDFVVGHSVISIYIKDSPEARCLECVDALSLSKIDDPGFRGVEKYAEYGGFKNVHFQLHGCSGFPHSFELPESTPRLSLPTLNVMIC